MFDKLTKLLRDENGATMVEYGLMVALIAVVCMAVVAIFGSKVRDMFILPEIYI